MKKESIDLPHLNSVRSENQELDEDMLRLRKRSRMSLD